MQMNSPNRCQILVIFILLLTSFFTYQLFFKKKSPYKEFNPPDIQDEIDLKSVNLKTNKTELFQKWINCAKKNLLEIEDSVEFWKKFQSNIKNCDEEAAVETLGLVNIFNMDEAKTVVFPKSNDGTTTFVTLGIGRDTTAELKYQRKMRKMGKPVVFYGADPITEVNSKLYSQFGKYFPFAVGKTSGYSIASVQLNGKYVDQSVVHIDIVYFLLEVLKIDKVDNLWMDVEFGEYELFDIFYKNGSFDLNGIEVCQVNLEVHISEKMDNGEYKNKFHQFIQKILSDGRFAIFRDEEAFHQRMFLFNFESEYCRKKF